MEAAPLAGVSLGRGESVHPGKSEQWITDMDIKDFASVIHTDPLSREWIRFRLSILGLVVVLGSVGCALPKQYSSPNLKRMARIAPLQAEMMPEMNENPRPAERFESPGEVIRPGPADPGAIDLVNSLLDDLGDPRRGPDGWTVIDCSNLRNQSRSSRREYFAFRRRLADLLSQAGHPHRLRFIDTDDEEFQYQLTGTLYLLTNGLDQWELFLSLRESRHNRVMWEPDGTVRVLRNPDSSQPQIQVLRSSD